MSFSTYYQAISVDSDLYRLLQEDRMAELLYLELWFQPKPFDHGEIRVEELAEIDNFLIEHLGLDNRDQVDRSLNRLKEAVARACDDVPNFSERTAWIQRIHGEVQSYLVKIFLICGIKNPKELSARLVFGESAMNHARISSQEGMSLISPGTLKRFFGIAVADRSGIPGSI